VSVQSKTSESIPLVHDVRWDWFTTRCNGGQVSVLVFLSLSYTCSSRLVVKWPILKVVLKTAIILRLILTDAHNQYVNANIQHSANSIEHICKKAKREALMVDWYEWTLHAWLTNTGATQSCLYWTQHLQTCGTFWIKHFRKMEHFNQHQFLLQRNPIAGVHYLLVLQRLFALYLG